MSSALRRSALPLALLLLALGASGCLGDDEEDGVTIPSTSVPVTTESTVSTFTTPTTETTTTAPEAPPDSDQPDAPANDVPPPSGSPEEQFEEFCKQNPEACG